MSENYKKYSQVEHVRARPDTYIGSAITTTENRWIFNKVENEYKAEFKPIKYNPGLEHCINELIVNAIDHACRCSVEKSEPVTKINIDITKDTFTIKNNGKGIPIEVHKEYGIYIPELIFGNMLTSSNYNDNVDRKWGGTNGIGAKAANIFSKQFDLELVTNNVKYTQTFTNGMSVKTEPIIKKTASNDYVKISFTPDFDFFKMKSFEDFDTKISIYKKIYDASAVTSKKVSIYLNDEKINLKDYKDYVSLFVKDKVIFYENNDWNIAFGINPFDTITHISFVNGIFTEDNGTHVNYILEPVIKKVIKDIQDMPKVKKDNITIKPSYIKDKLFIFVKCLIKNPRFNSQIKTQLKTSPSDFGTTCVIPDDIIKKITKLGFIDEIVELAKIKEINIMKKSTSATKKVRLSDIPKLDDAILAGTSKSNECTLILTEGDSAKATALSGLTILDNKKWGVFPLKGKLLNVRTATIKQLTDNEELKNINKILGLSHDNKSDKSKLRYGNVMVMCDQDVDGYHIKSLLMNYFTFYWPDIVRDDFISTLLTPIVKVNIKKEELSFYNLYEFEEWRLKNKDNNFKFKYYKGLGTSNSTEAKEYFKNLTKNRVMYTYDKKTDNSRLELAFDKKNADNRKDWISQSIVKLKSGSNIDYNIKKVSISNFIDNELVMFSIYDCVRSLPNIIDGLKPSQRKVLYGSIKKNINTKSKEIKVAQLCSYIAETTEYHHGEESLNETITNMAQDFVGSGNMKLLNAEGQFGTRNKGGSDASSPRYIYTYLKEWIPYMFNNYDSEIIEYNYEDSLQIEPKFYVPILPMILINGASGIGTGWSCDFPCFNPSDIIDRIRKLLNNQPIEELTPWYRGFKGKIFKIAKNKWISRGIYKKNGKNVKVSEVPINMWYEVFKENLKKLEQDSVLTYSDKPGNDGKYDYIDFDITFEKEVSDDDIIKLLHLDTPINATNLVGFDKNNIIRKYENVEQIINDFFEYRLELYSKRRLYILDNINKKIEYLSEKARFVNLIINEELVINKKKKDDLYNELTQLKFTIIEDLLNMKIYSLTREKIDEINNEIQKLKNEYTELLNKSPKDLWLEELNIIEKYL